MLPSCDPRACANTPVPWTVRISTKNFIGKNWDLEIHQWQQLEAFTVKVPWQKKLIDGIIFQFWLMPAKKVCKITVKWSVKYTWVVDQTENIINHHLSSRSIPGESFNFYHLWNLRFLTPPPPPISLPDSWKLKKFLIHLIEKV